MMIKALQTLYQYDHDETYYEKLCKLAIQLASYIAIAAYCTLCWMDMTIFVAIVTAPAGTNKHEHKCQPNIVIKVTCMQVHLH